MTRATRAAETPRVESQATPSRRTTYAAHPQTLADLCNDAAGADPGQRFTLRRNAGGLFHFFYQPTAIARFLVLRACVLRTGTYSFPDAVTFDLSIDDNVNPPILSSDPTIPDGLKADQQFVPIEEEGGRFATASHQSWALDLVALRGAGLSSTSPWRFTLSVTCDPTAVCELFQMEEVTRFAVDDAEVYGELPQDYQPRSPINNGAHGLERLLTTLREAHYSGLRTYHQLAVSESAPLTRTLTSYGALNGDVETGTTPNTWRMRARKMRGAAADGARVRWMVRYKIVGATGTDKGFVRLHTGGASSPYVIPLPDISGAWVDSDVGVAWLATNGAGAIDALHFEAKVDAGTLSICARAVWDYPA